MSVTRVYFAPPKSDGMGGVVAFGGCGLGVALGAGAGVALGAGAGVALGVALGASRSAA